MKSRAAQAGAITFSALAMLSTLVACGNSDDARCKQLAEYFANNQYDDGVLRDEYNQRCGGV